MKKLIQKSILIVSLAAFAVALPGCGGEAEEADQPEEADPANEEGVENEVDGEGGGE